MSAECVYNCVDICATGQRIWLMMDSCGFSVRDIASSLSVSTQTVYKWLHGKCLPTLENVVQLSELFDVPIDNLIVRGKKLVYTLPAPYVREGSAV